MYLEDLHSQEQSLTEEIANITYHYKGISWDEAWSLSYTERNTVVNILNKIIKAQNDAINKK